MDYLLSAQTNIGLVKKTNQDSVTLKKANTPIGKIALGVLCDGMGGLAEGEVASATVVSAFSQWFSHTLPAVISAYGYNISETVFRGWSEIINSCNEKLHEYGRARGISLGTTCSAILITENAYYFAHVGDSRIYEITDTNFTVLTEDQTFVEREVREGRLSPEQAANDPRRSILLQCIGASNNVVPQFVTGQTRQNATYMLCSDGFRHIITPQEIYSSYTPMYITDTGQIDRNSKALIELNMQRGEEDNITVGVIRTF